MGPAKRLGLKKLLGSKRTRQLSALSMVAQAGTEFKRGDVRTAALYLVGAAVAYRNGLAGFGAQALLRWRGRR